jgi:hypothetical protein
MNNQGGVGGSQDRFTLLGFNCYANFDTIFSTKKFRHSFTNLFGILEKDVMTIYYFLFDNKSCIPFFVCFDVTNTVHVVCMVYSNEWFPNNIY